MPLTPLQLVAVLLAAVNLLAFFLMGWDKRLAKRKAHRPQVRRIPERVLFLWAALGGGVGATAGMLLFRHKTRHWYFRLGFPALALLQLALLVWLIVRGLLPPA